MGQAWSEGKVIKCVIAELTDCFWEPASPADYPCAFNHAGNRVGAASLLACLKRVGLQFSMWPRQVNL